MSGERYILCVACRAEFTDEEVADGWGCPKCGNKGIPADTRQKATAALTHHEWRLLFMWAHRWAEQCDKNEPREGYSSVTAIESIMREVRRQDNSLEMVALFLGEELRDLANAMKTDVTMYKGDGTVVTTKPEGKN